MVAEKYSDLTYVKNLIKRKIDEENEKLLAFVDLRAAFNTVDR